MGPSRPHFQSSCDQFSYLDKSWSLLYLTVSEDHVRKGEMPQFHRQTVLRKILIVLFAKKLQKRQITASYRDWLWTV